MDLFYPFPRELPIDNLKSTVSMRPSMGDWLSNVKPPGDPISNVGPVFYFKLKDDPVGDPKDTVGLVTNIKKTDGPRATWVNSRANKADSICCQLYF